MNIFRFHSIPYKKAVNQIYKSIQFLMEVNRRYQNFITDIFTSIKESD